MRMWFSLYELKPIRDLRGLSFLSKGVLLKFEEERYSLYHPINNLGDRSLKDFFKNLSLQDDLFKRVKEASVSIDDFKKQKENKISCYYSAPSFDFFLKNQIKIKNKGFKTIKIKVSSVNEIKENLCFIKKIPFKFIFDFNGKGVRKDFINCNKDLKFFFKDQVIYVEDPCLEKLKLSYLKVASDFNKYDGEENYIIIKPTGFNHSLPDFNPENSVVTSYLDHPLGQIIAALWAVKHKIKLECGLFSHSYYEKTAYSEILDEMKTEINFLKLLPFFKLLKNEPWVKV